MDIIEIRQGDESVEFATIQSRLALTFQEAGRYSDAMPLWSDAVRIFELNHATKHPGYANAVSDKAIIEWRTGSLREAKQGFLLGLKLCRAIYGPNHRSIASSIHNLGAVSAN